VQLNTATGGVLQNAKVSISGGDIYDSAIVPDQQGDLFGTLTFSSGASPISPEAFVISGGSFGSNPVAGYSYGSLGGVYSGVRWGDYCSAVRDPGDPSKIWVVDMLPVAGNWSTQVTQIHT
jgi:hypothetical protein